MVQLDMKMMPSIGRLDEARQGVWDLKNSFLTFWVDRAGWNGLKVHRQATTSETLCSA